MTIWQAVLLGTVEGLTEFLPVSSTAHLMLTARLLDLEQSEFVKTFEIAIQPGAILAVMVLYGRTLLVDRRVMLRVVLAFLPTAVLGLVFYKLIKDYLMESHATALAALAVGGVVLILFELWHRERPGAGDELGRLPVRDCLLVGVFQSLAFVPGVSRAAATIVGGLLLGWNRRTAVEFSFLLAVPTMAASTALDVVKNRDALTPETLPLLLVGFVTSFVVAVLAIRFLLRYIRTHTFIPFGVYRIAFAGLLAAALYLG